MPVTGKINGQSFKFSLAFLSSKFHHIICLHNYLFTHCFLAKLIMNFFTPNPINDHMPLFLPTPEFVLQVSVITHMNLSSVLSWRNEKSGKGMPTLYLP